MNRILIFSSPCIAFSPRRVKSASAPRYEPCRETFHFRVRRHTGKGASLIGKAAQHGRLTSNRVCCLCCADKDEGVFMSIEDDCKEVVRAYAAAFSRGDLAALKALLADDAEIQGVLGKGTFEKIEPIWRQLIE